MLEDAYLLWRNEDYSHDKLCSGWKPCEAFGVVRPADTWPHDQHLQCVREGGDREQNKDSLHICLVFKKNWSMHCPNQDSLLICWYCVFLFCGMVGLFFVWPCTFKKFAICVVLSQWCMLVTMYVTVLMGGWQDSVLVLDLHVMSEPVAHLNWTFHPAPQLINARFKLFLNLCHFHSA